MIFADKEMLANYPEMRDWANRICMEIRKKLVDNGVTACTCEKCKTLFPLSFIDIHHEDAIAAGGKPDGSTITVCRKCHYKLHGKEYDPVKLLIETSDWIAYAEQGLNQEQIAILYDVRSQVVSKTWGKDGHGVNWSTFSRYIKRGKSFKEIMIAYGSR